MNNLSEVEPQYEATSNRLFAFLATNSDISKLALKIQATNSFKMNTYRLKKASMTAV